MLKSISILFCLVPLAFIGCREKVAEEQTTEVHKVHLPSKHYNYVDKLPAVKLIESVYVPIYSDIYVINGERKYSLTATLSIRNTSQEDSLFLTKVDYFDSKGKLMRKYVEKPILLKTLESVEFIVDYQETKGGAGANFIVDWSAQNADIKPIIQAVMIGSDNHHGISFLTNGVTVSSIRK